MLAPAVPAVDDRHRRPSGGLGGRALLEVPHRDHVAVVLQHVDRVLDRLLVEVARPGHLGVGEPEHVAAQPVHGRLGGQAGPGARLVERRHQGLLPQELAVAAIPRERHAARRPPRTRGGTRRARGPSATGCLVRGSSSSASSVLQVPADAGEQHATRSSVPIDPPSHERRAGRPARPTPCDRRRSRCSPARAGSRPRAAPRSPRAASRRWRASRRTTANQSYVSSSTIPRADAPRLPLPGPHEARAVPPRRTASPRPGLRPPRSAPRRVRRPRRKRRAAALGLHRVDAWHRCHRPERHAPRGTSGRRRSRGPRRRPARSRGRAAPRSHGARRRSPTRASRPPRSPGRCRALAGERQGSLRDRPTEPSIGRVAGRSLLPRHRS